MPVTFTKRRGKVIGMTMSFAEMRWAYKVLTGRKLENDSFQESGAELMRDFTEKQIADAVATYDREAFLNGNGY